MCYLIYTPTVILGGRSYCPCVTEKKQTRLGFALGPLAMIDSSRTDSRVCAIIVLELSKLWADKGETYSSASRILKGFLLTSF